MCVCGVFRLKRKKRQTERKQMRKMDTAAEEKGEEAMEKGEEEAEEGGGDEKEAEEDEPHFVIGGN